MNEQGLAALLKAGGTDRVIQAFGAGAQAKHVKRLGLADEVKEVPGESGRQPMVRGVTRSSRCDDAGPSLRMGYVREN